ncbi:MAG: 16S rRNA (guanine(527)-N(7))-methyltransferase RsmG [Congregibacter sp.]
MTLEDGMRELGLDLIEPAASHLHAYVNLLNRWNKRFNLTAVRDPREMIVRHLLDSLVVTPWLHGKRLIDVGTGGGLPGIPLAIVCPEKRFVLLDSNGKKTRFLTQVKTELSLENVDIVHSRVEAYVPAAPFDIVLSRAFASLNDMIAGCRNLIAENGQFLAMKGQVPDAELAALSTAGYHAQVHELSVPGLDEERCLVVIEGSPQSGSVGT